jgi:hypothetical protein
MAGSGSQPLPDLVLRGGRTMATPPPFLVADPPLVHLFSLVYFFFLLIFYLVFKKIGVL